MNKNDIDENPVETPSTPVATVAEERESGDNGTQATTEAAGEVAAPAESDESAESDAPAPAAAPTYSVRGVEQSDFFAWYDLFSQYADFYNETLTDDRAMRAWAMLLSPEFQTRALVAVDEAGEVVGLAHVRPFERVLEGDTGLYLDDLYVSPSARNRGVGRTLIEAVSREARESGQGVVRWITAEDNETARKLYDSVAKKTPWVTYDISLG